MQEPRFLIDGMLGGLARWLRLLGQEVYYSNQSDDDYLLSKALDQDYTLLTSDLALYQKAKAKGINSLLIKGKNEPDRIAEITSRFHIPLKVNPDKSRCPRCGFPLGRVDKRRVKGKIHEKSFEKHNKYWICLNGDCKKIYWRGSHWKNIEKTLSKASASMRRMKKGENQLDN